MTDIVGTTHLTVVNARFARDPIWSLGMVAALDLLLKNYPDVDNREKIVSSLFQAVELDEKVIRDEAAIMKEWISGKSKDDVLSALKGEVDSPFKDAVVKAKDDSYWMYSRFFGIGLVALMEDVGVEMNADDVYPVMEDWMKNGIGKSHFTACVSTFYLYCFTLMRYYGRVSHVHTLFPLPSTPLFNAYSLIVIHTSKSNPNLT